MPDRRALVAGGGLVWLLGACHARSDSSNATAASSAGATATAASAPRRESYLVDGNRHEGVVFVPERRGPKPTVVLFDPHGSAELAVRLWIPAASAAGWIVASTPLVMNGTPDESDEREMLALLRALEVDFEVDRERVYTGGVSGGGDGAYRLAILHSDVFSGSFVQVAQMASWREGNLAARVTRRDQRFYLFTRDQDFNRGGTYGLADVMQKAGLEVTVVEHLGGHQGMTSDEIRAAIAWMSRR